MNVPAPTRTTETTSNIMALDLESASSFLKARINIPIDQAKSKIPIYLKISNITFKILVIKADVDVFAAKTDIGAVVASTAVRAATSLLPLDFMHDTFSFALLRIFFNFVHSFQKNIANRFA